MLCHSQSGSAQYNGLQGIEAKLALQPSFPWAKDVADTTAVSSKHVESGRQKYCERSTCGYLADLLALLTPLERDELSLRWFLVVLDWNRWLHEYTRVFDMLRAIIDSIQCCSVGVRLAAGKHKPGKLSAERFSEVHK